MKKMQKLNMAIAGCFIMASAIMSTAVSASDYWTKQLVKVSVVNESTGKSQEASFGGLLYDDVDDGTISDDTLYVGVDSLFGKGSMAEKAGLTWSVKDGYVLIKSLTGVSKVAITTVDGVAYVPALDTVRALPLNTALINNNTIFASIW